MGPKKWGLKKATNIPRVLQLSMEFQESKLLLGTGLFKYK
jgi:hypothetical protein